MSSTNVLPDWVRAHAVSRPGGVIKSQPSDFLVTEQLGFEPDGDGEFAYCFVEKTALNTTQVADQLAKVAGVRSRDVSFSGMKDRQASTRQWFSVHLPGRQSPNFENVRPQG